MAWVKLHDDILGDPKLMRTARRGGQELVLLPWLLAFASKAADHGRLSVGVTAAEPEDLAYQIPGVTAAQVEACQRALVAIGVLVADDDGCLRFARWEDRQAKPSDSKSAIRERVQKHRNNKRAERNAPPALQGDTGDKKAPRKGGVTPRNATDKRRGEEKREEAEKRVSPPSGDPAAVTGDGNTPPAPPAETDGNPNLDAFPMATSDAAYERWQARIGDVNYGRLRKALLGPYKAKEIAPPTEAELLGGIDAFADARAADKPQYWGKYTVEMFAGALREYVRLGAMQYLDEWGEPTERGRMAGVGT
jgi:hypothetical protein